MKIAGNSTYAIYILRNLETYLKSAFNYFKKSFLKVAYIITFMYHHLFYSSQYKFISYKFHSIYFIVYNKKKEKKN